MSASDLYEEYIHTFNHMLISECDGDELEADDANCRLSDIKKGLISRKLRVIFCHETNFKEGILTNLKGDEVCISCDGKEIVTDFDCVSKIDGCDINY